MNTKWDEIVWRQEFLEMKAHKPDEIRLLVEGAKSFRDAWHLGSLHEEYKRLKKRQINESDQSKATLQY